MNELLQKHGCANVFSVPEGLKELMADISREVLREQPERIYEFISGYLSCLLVSREHGLMALRVLDDLCDCRPTVSEHLLGLGLDEEQVNEMKEIIKTKIEGGESEPETEEVKEAEIVEEILSTLTLDEDMTTKVCQVIRNAYKDYWYRKRILQKGLIGEPEQPWEVAANRTLQLYKETKPTFNELSRAAVRIQAAYRGYHVRTSLLHHMKVRKKLGPKRDMPGPPLDIAMSREMSFGPMLKLEVRTDDNVHSMFAEDAILSADRYDPLKAVIRPYGDDSKRVSPVPSQRISFSQPWDAVSMQHDGVLEGPPSSRYVSQAVTPHGSMSTGMPEINDSAEMKVAGLREFTPDHRLSSVGTEEIKEILAPPSRSASKNINNAVSSARLPSSKQLSYASKAKVGSAKELPSKAVSIRQASSHARIGSRREIESTTKSAPSAIRSPSGKGFSSMQRISSKKESVTISEESTSKRDVTSATRGPSFEASMQEGSKSAIEKQDSTSATRMGSVGDVSEIPREASGRAISRTKIPSVAAVASTAGAPAPPTSITSSAPESTATEYPDTDRSDV
ncbi:unnamed protein product [Plutella xylostella]|uniref:(diamondback moth) hypothetical protein n=1 Tax=Plutella xylostella TaxID=51655 RepID=A0A8S4FTN6_PLUXY|nr:unnamed protein product [Plutella xylostella]